MAALITKPSLIEAAGMKFLIIDAPREQNLHLYLKEFKKYNVKHLVRIDVTPPGYSGEDVEKAGIVMHVRFLCEYLDVECVNHYFALFLMENVSYYRKCFSMMVRVLRRRSSLNGVLSSI